MVDFYGLPTQGERAWPGRASDPNGTTESRAQSLEAALADNFASDASDHTMARRFIPFVVMHEFEGLLFSDCAAFARGLAQNTI